MAITQLIRPWRPMQEVLGDWTDELSVRLNRSADSIRSKGLGATDFSPLESVDIRYPSGMAVHVPFAFAVFRPSSNLCAVFSEHAGYLEFEMPEETRVISTRQDWYHQP